MPMPRTAAFILMMGFALHIPSLGGFRPDREEIEAVLQDVAWTEISAAGHATYGRSRWTGPDDLSFRYRVAVHGGDLYLHVEVTDDLLVSVGGAPLASDHVELWLADPALAATAAERLERAEAAVREFEGRLGDGSCDDWEAEYLGGRRKVLSELKRLSALRQIIFEGTNDSEAWAFWGDLAPFSDVNWSEGGYALFARIPLYLSFPLQETRISEIAYLVDVVDVDTPGSEKQETLLSCSKERRYGDAATFLRMRLSPSWEPGTIPCWEEEALASGRGFWRAGDRYEAVLWKDDAWSGCYGADRALHPGTFEALPGPIAPGGGSGLRFVPLDDSLLVTDGRRCTALPFDGLVHAAGGREWRPLYVLMEGKTTYAVLSVIGMSRWPPGSTMCGAGMEADLIWFAMDDAFRITSKAGHHYESCWTHRTTPGVTIGTKVLVMETETYADEREITQVVTFDARNPSEGLRVLEKAKP